MNQREFEKLLIAEAMQRHRQIVSDANNRLSVAANEYDSAKNALDRAKCNEAAFKSFVQENKP